jgi:hypothetical protein
MTDIPDSLLRFGALLEGAIERDRRRDRRRARGRVALRVSAVAAAATAIALGVTSVLGGDGSIVGRSVVGTASARERAVAVLSPPGGGIVHDVATYEHLGPDGDVRAWRQENWRQTIRPYARREVITRDGARLETATTGGQSADLYDAATGTIYTNPPSSGPGLATPQPASDGDPLRAQLLDLLRSGAGQAVTRSVEGQRHVIRFSLPNRWPDGTVVTWTYVVDAETYEPIVLTAETPDGARTTTRFVRYETLPGDDTSTLSLRAQHPDAVVDDTQRGYAEAQARLTG